LFYIYAAVEAVGGNATCEFCSY